MHLIYQKIHPGNIEQLIELVRLYERVFEMKQFGLPKKTYLETLLNNPSIIFYIALQNTTIVGGLTAYILPSVYFSASEMYIYDLAVDPVCQRQGIGRNLITGLKEYAASLGHKEVFVQADLEDQHAIDFYTATGGTAERVVHFSYALGNENK